MSVSTTVLNCHHCAGAIEARGDTKRVDCPYCGASVWAPIATQEMGEANRRLLQILETDFASELARIEQIKSVALQEGDRKAYEAVISEEAKVHAAAYDKIDYWKIFGVDRETFIAQYVEQNMVDLNRRFAQMSPDATGPPEVSEDDHQLQRYQQAYSEALANQDAQAFARYWRKYMEKSLRRGAGADMTEEEIEYQITGSMETMLRDQPWVGPDELEALGFDVIYDAQSEPGGARSVACQNCSAPLEVEGDVEFVECPFCEAVTHLQLTMSEQVVLASQRVDDRGGGGSHSGAAPSAPLAGATGGSDAHGQLDLARNAVESAYPDTDIASPQGRVLIYYFLENMAGPLTDSEASAVRAQLKLGEGTVTCGVCETNLAEVSPALQSCVVCQQPLSPSCH